MRVSWGPDSTFFEETLLVWIGRALESNFLWLKKSTADLAVFKKDIKNQNWLLAMHWVELASHPESGPRSGSQQIPKIQSSGPEDHGKSNGWVMLKPQKIPSLIMSQPLKTPICFDVKGMQTWPNLSIITHKCQTHWNRQFLSMIWNDGAKVFLCSKLFRKRRCW